MSILGTTFRGTQIEFLDYIQQLHNRYVIDEADFQDFNPIGFPNTFKQNFQSAIDNARAVPTDEMIVDQQAQKTEAVKNQMSVCIKLYNKAIYFVQEAFPSQEKIWNEFGYNDYAESKLKVEAFILFLERFVRTCDKYITQLQAVNYTSTQVGDVATAANLLKQNHFDQKTAIDYRPQVTFQREQVFAEVWEMVLKISKAGKLIYDGLNTAKYKLYLLPSSKTKTKPSETIAAGGKEIIMEDVAEEDYFELANTGSNSLSFFISTSTSNAVPSTAIVLQEGESQIFSATELGYQVGEGIQHLIAWNGNAQVGKFTVSQVE